MKRALAALANPNGSQRAPHLNARPNLPPGPVTARLPQLPELPPQPALPRPLPLPMRPMPEAADSVTVKDEPHHTVPPRD
jgi:hypothetical protein